MTPLDLPGHVLLAMVLDSKDVTEATFRCEEFAEYLRRGGEAPAVPGNARNWSMLDVPYTLTCPFVSDDKVWRFVYWRPVPPESWILPGPPCRHPRGTCEGFSS